MTDRIRAWRDHDQQPVGIFITAAGRVAIGSGEDNPPDSIAIVELDAAAADIATSSRHTNKTELLLELLRHADGATIAELTTATGWLPHTTRAALTGLRKKGHAVERTKRGDDTCYRIAAA